MWYLYPMSFNYSYRAFLITSLLTGSLVLLLFSVKLTKIDVPTQEESYNVVLAPEDVLPEPEEIASLSADQVKIETNKAYNEAEKFISTVENENADLTETTEGKLQAMEEALSESEALGEEVLETLPKKPAEKKKKSDFSNGTDTSENISVTEGGNRNTTISYQLVDRRDLQLPNPVYTCYGSGKIVINIEVDNLGMVKRTSYNRNVSSTSNQCLIDAAMEYASQARFSADPSRPKQLGTITFNFPGQR